MPNILNMWDEQKQAYVGINVLRGENGKTPVKGVDYFTEDDISEIVQRVLDAMPKAENTEF